MNAPWYAEGLRFSCTRCGRCCGGSPGYVWVEPEEMDRLARHLGMGLDAFTRQHVRRVGGRDSLREREDYTCIFWDAARGCTVYEARPGQCRSFPFWPENLASREAWGRVEADCPGSGSPEGRLHTREEIEAMAQS
ncbi:MAG: YkgJ family cysteine cluster protein [Planctomycetes bacterium]|nr:YkgJ family cysteine cluster protein [Planctomycetota bacterium]